MPSSHLTHCSAPEISDHAVLISALQHVLFCPRQCALIHVDQEWSENVYTVEGQLLHERADSGKSETRGAVRTETGVLLASRKWDLTGKADIVEFHRKGNRWIPFPVEYKRGRPKESDADRVQLCAQALCLEEMTDQDVPEGALFYGKIRRREMVAFTESLRKATVATIIQVKSLLDTKQLPPPIEDQGRCRACSMHAVCMPHLHGKPVGSYLVSLCEEK